MGLTIHYSGMIDAIASGLSEGEPLPEEASVEDIIARIEAIVKKL